MNRAHVLALASSLTLAAPAVADIHTLYLHDYSFSTNPLSEQPTINTITISTGDTVRWVWVANFHSILQTDGPGLTPPFQSPLTDVQGFTFEHTFIAPGFYTYICEIHGSQPMPGHPMGMWGSVTVIPAPPLAALALIIAPALSRRRCTPSAHATSIHPV